MKISSILMMRSQIPGAKMDFLILLRQLGSHLEKNEIKFIPRTSHKSKLQVKQRSSVKSKTV